MTDITEKNFKKINSLHTKSHDFSDKNYVRILSIDGGGVKGLVPALILAELQKKSGKPVQQQFDYIIGTSIGGIIATALAAPNVTTGGFAYQASDLPGVLNRLAPEIFPQHWFNSVKYLFGPKYNRDNLDLFLDNNLGELRSNETLLPLSVFSFCLNIQEPRFWSSLDAGFPYYLKDAAGATSAAPTYFAPKKTLNQSCVHEAFKKNPHYKKFIRLKPWEKECALEDVDGGTYVNNPAIFGFSVLSSKAKHIKMDNVMIVSLGTGQAPAASDSAIGGALDAVINIDSLIDEMSGGAEYVSGLNAQMMFGDRYIVFNPFIDKKNSAIDDSSEENLEELSSTVSKYIAHPVIQKSLEELVGCLDRFPQGESDDCVRATKLLKSAGDINYMESLVEASGTEAMEHADL